MLRILSIKWLCRPVQRITTTQFYSSTSSALLTATAKDNQRQKSDDLSAIIKSSNSPFELLDTISLRRKELTNIQAIHCLKAIFALQKHGESTVRSAKIIKSPDFDLLCRKIKSHARIMQLNDVIEMLKILIYLGVPANSPINLTLMHVIRHRINDITLGHIIFLDFLLRRADNIPIVDALKMALPMLLQIQIGTQMDHDNLHQLSELLHFVTRNQVSEQCTMSIVTALTLHGEEMTVDQARSIVWSLCDLRHFNVNYEKLLNNCINVMIKSIDLLTFDALDATMSKMLDKFMLRNSCFYHDSFYNACLQYVIENDVGFIQAIFLQKKLSKIGFVSTKLCDYISAHIINDPSLLSPTRPMALFTTISALSTANYRPPNFEQLKKIIIENIRHHHTKTDLPWVKLTLELMSIDIPSHGLVNKIFQREFLDSYLTREFNNLDYLQLLTLHQCVNILWPEYDGRQLDQQFIEQGVQVIETILSKVDCPLKDAIDAAFGGEQYVYHRVKTQWGHILEYLITFDEAGNPLTRKNHIEKNGTDISRIIGVNKMIAITPLSRTHFAINSPILKGIHQLRLKTLSEIGIPVVVINLDLWSQLLDQEKIPYIQREINYQSLVGLSEKM